MNREQRRRAGTPRGNGINWAAEPPDLCPVATRVIAAVKAGSPEWIVQVDPCSRCKLYTVVASLEQLVFACLACGCHGELGDADAEGKMVLH